MPRDYLLDTNILSYWFDPNCAEHELVKSRLLALANSARQPTLFISSITIGEIEYGHQAEQQPLRQAIQAQFWGFLEARLVPIDVRRSTGLEYGALRAALFERFAPRKGRRRGLRVEQLVHPVTAKSLGIQENDLWIAAQALEYDLTLVTHDAMTPIRQCADERLKVEDWAS